MPAPFNSQEDNVLVGSPDGSSRKIRNLSVTTLVNGVPTLVDLQVVAIAGPDGQTIDIWQDYNWQLAVLQELREIRKLLGVHAGVAAFIPETPELHSR
jgi:hypothetical protein